MSQSLTRCCARSDCWLVEGHRGTLCMTDRDEALAHLRRVRDLAHQQCRHIDAEIEAVVSDYGAQCLPFSS